jgi:alpha-L-fucosidase 2
MGPSHDQEIIDELFGHVLKAAQVLQINQDTNLVKIQVAKSHLLMPQIAADGRLMEWAQPFEETELGHRHLSHLYAFYPGYQYTQAQTPDYANAVRKSLEVRLQNGLGYVGWSGGWVSNLWARFGEGNKALQAVNNVLATHTAPNLFDIPPFQIDGNMGVTAGIAEMLLQSHQGFVDLLPALPSDWSTGEVKGLCARGAFVVDMTWEKGQLTGVVLHAKNGGSVTLHHAGQTITLSTRAGASIHLNGQLKVVRTQTGFAGKKEQQGLSITKP